MNSSMPPAENPVDDFILHPLGDVNSRIVLRQFFRFLNSSQNSC